MDPYNVVTNGRWFCALFVVINLVAYAGQSADRWYAFAAAMVFAALPGISAVSEQTPYGIRLPLTYLIYASGVAGVVLTAIAGLY